MSSNSISAASAIAQAAKAAFEASQLVPSSERVKALAEIRKELENAKAEILDANRRDLQVRASSHNIKLHILMTLIVQGCPNRGRCWSHGYLTSQAA